MNASPLALRATQGSSLLLYESENGAVRAALRYARATPARMEFALDVINATPEPLLATIYALARNGQEIPLPPYSLWIDARSEGFLTLPLSWMTAFTCNALSVRLQGRNVHQRLEAAMPRPASFVWFLAGAALVAAVAAGMALAHPVVESVNVPATAVAGSKIEVSYRARGVGATRWALEDVRGARVASGGFAAGSAQIEMPRPLAQAVYDVVVNASGPFGSASVQRPVVVVTPRPAVAPPRIISFAVDGATVPDGGTIIARYRVSADTGDVLAVDAQGTIWAQSVIRSDGVTQLALPPFHRNKELQIRLVVRRGPQLAAAGIGVESIAQ